MRFLPTLPRSCPLLRLLRAVLDRARRALPLVLLFLPLLAPAQPFPETKLLPSDGAPSDLFGSAVALSGDGAYALVGADGRDGNRGRVYVFVRVGDAWVEQAALSASDGAGGDKFGSVVSISADGAYALVGAPGDDDAGDGSGSAYVFARTGETWVEQAKLTASDAGGQHTFGNTVALSADGTAALVGAIGTGNAYVFTRTGDAWAERDILTGSPGEGFGIDVALDGDGRYALVGARFGNNDAGSAYVFERNGGAWVEQAVLTAADGATSDDFAWRVALAEDGRYALLGARLDADDEDNAGSAYVFARTGTTWVEQTELHASDGEGADQLGFDVALSGDGTRVLASAPYHTVDGVGSGSAFLFTRTGATWTEEAEVAPGDGTDSDIFGSSVTLSGDGRYALVGAPLDDDNGGNSGSAYVYDLAPPPPAGDAYVYTLGGVSFDEGAGVGVDAEGNATFAGEFRGTLDFDPGADAHPLTSTQSDVYVASYDPAGALRFAFQIGNGLATSEEAGDLAVGADGGFVVTGRQPFGAIDFDPDPVGEELRTGKLFVAGYDATGGFRFAVAPEGGTTSSGIGRAAAIDAAGNAYVTGEFNGTLNFAPGAPQPVFLTSEGGSDAFLVSYAPDGAFRFAVRLGGVHSDAGEGVAVDAAGNVYVTGRRGTQPPEPGRGDGAMHNAFLASYGPDGALRFSYLFGFPVGFDSGGEALALDDAGNVYLAGAFAGTTTFDPEDADGDGDVVEVTEVVGGSAFLASYTSDGLFRFVSVPDGTSNTLGLATRGDGVSVVTGTFGGTLDFGVGGGAPPLDAGDGMDVFVASYDASGAPLSAFGFGGDGLNTGRGVAVDAAGGILLTGAFTNTTDFDPGDGTDERTSAGQNDLFMMKVRPESPPVAVEEPVRESAGAVLSAAYPNPVRQRASVTVMLARSEVARVTVFDVLGREVRVLHEGVLPAGIPVEVTLPAERLASGVYVVRVVTPTLAESRRVTVQR